LQEGNRATTALPDGEKGLQAGGLVGKTLKGGPFKVSKEHLIVVEGKIAVSSFKELAALLWQAKKTGQMFKNIQSLLHLFERQERSDPGNLFPPTPLPVLKALIGKIRPSNSLPALSITLPLPDVPQNAFDYFHGLAYTVTEERRQQAKGL
jgi:hypothetical protein